MSLQIKQFSLFDSCPGLIHGFSKRQGGLSNAPFKGLNLGLTTGDDVFTVRKNRSLFFKTLNIPADRLVFPQQVHGDRVRIVDQPGKIPNCDALITDTPDLFLTIQTADCFPVFLCDPVKRVVAIVHSGWRGTAQNIVGKTIDWMIRRFESIPGKLLAAIGAGIQQSCYQVDEQTAKQFAKVYLLPDGVGRFKLNIQGAIIDQLLERGLPREQIEYDPTCTHCNKNDYYSFRRDGTNSGRMMGVIGLLP